MPRSARRRRRRAWAVRRSPRPAVRSTLSAGEATAAQPGAMSRALTVAVVGEREVGLVWLPVDFARCFRAGDGVVGRHVEGGVVGAAGDGVVLGQASDAWRVLTSMAPQEVGPPGA